MVSFFFLLVIKGRQHNIISDSATAFQQSIICCTKCVRLQLFSFWLPNILHNTADDLVSWLVRPFSTTTGRLLTPANDDDRRTPSDRQNEFDAETRREEDLSSIGYQSSWSTTATAKKKKQKHKKLRHRHWYCRHRQHHLSTSP